MIKTTLMAATALVVATCTPAVAQTTNTVTSSLPVVNYCSGGSGGNYEYSGRELSRQVRSQVDVQVINTRGSWDNLERIESGECDMGIVQSDALYVWETEGNPFNFRVSKPMFTEYVHMICRRDLGVDSIQELDENASIYAGEIGSGANVSIRGMIAADEEHGGSEFTGFALRNEGGEAAAVFLADGDADCMIFTAAPGTTFMNTVERFSDDLVMITVEDKDFNDVVVEDSGGNEVSVWTPVTLPGDSYGDIMPGGLFGNSSVDTFGVQATLVFNEDWVQSNREVFTDLRLAIQDLSNIIRSGDRELILVE